MWRPLAAFGQNITAWTSGDLAADDALAVDPYSGSMVELVGSVESPEKGMEVLILPERIRTGQSVFFQVDLQSVVGGNVVDGQP